MKNPGWRGWSWLLLAGLAVSLGLNCFLAGALRQYYQQQLAAQIWPAAAGDHPVITGVTNGFTRTILLVGDSRMAEWPLPAPPGTRLVNAGIRRATTAQILPQLPGWLDSFKPNLVLIEAGINDLKYIGLEPSRADEIIALTFNNLTNLAGQSLTRHCPVILLPVWPPDQPDWRRQFVWNAAISQSVNRLNRRLLASAVPPDLQVVDLFALAGLHPSSETYRDTLHLRPETYRCLTETLTNQPVWRITGAP